MKILGIIPARSGSKGIPGKNIKLLSGKPLIHYTIASAFESRLLTDIMVSTEDKEIATVAQSGGAIVPFMRPQNLARDNSGSLEMVLHVVEEYEKRGDYFDAVCLLQPTSPFRKPDLIDECISKFIKSGADSLITVRKVPHEFNPHWVFEETDDQFLKIATGESEIIRRRQELPNAYYRDGSVYLTKLSVLKEQKTFYGHKIAYYTTDNFPYVNLDSMEDWYRAEEILNTNE